jgi:tRNA nucleotidyltransferase/poly(A) polymerase
VPELDPKKQRDFALDVVRRLREAGFEAYWAGGCVRDCLLERAPKDYDVATNARPPAILEVFRHRRTLEIGAAFGVVAVVGPRPAGTVEVTTFRHDVQYSDGRRPDAVVFTTAQEDARRRDFTINGLFYDPLVAEPEHRVIDYVGGIADLRKRVVRAIGDPKARFSEDKLRLLRAVRMASTFDFAIDEHTQAAISEFAPLVTTVSAERISQEMRQMLVHLNRARAVEVLRETGLLEAILPESAPSGAPAGVEPTSRENRWRHVLLMLSRLSQPSFPLALAALLEAIESPGEPAGKQVETICRRWRLSNKDIERTRWLAERRRALRDACSMPWPRLQRLLISEGIEELIALHEADALAAGGDLAHLVRCRELLELPADKLNPPPLVSGDDLIRHGIRAGKQFKLLLEQIRDAQLEGQVGTTHEGLQLAERLLAQAAGEGV